MEDYQVRVVVERNDLKVKLQHLEAFLERKDAMRVVGQEEYARLSLQRSIMMEYVDVLEDRIDHFPTNNKVLRDGATKNG